MRAICSHQKSLSNACPLFSTAALSLLALASWALPAQAQTKVVLSQVTQTAAYPSAGGLSGGNPAGSTMGVNQQGMVIFGNSYGNDVLELNPTTGVVTTLGAPGNVGAVAVDAKNNYYFSNLYQTAIVKIPYVNGAYAAFNASPSVSCTGTDTAACNVQGLTNGANGYYFGVLSMTFDTFGDLFFGLTNGNTAPNAIFECTAACQTGNGTATLIYQEPTNSAAQLTIGGMVADAYGDLFFTDSAETSSQVSTVSNVNELVYTIGSGFAAKPVVLYTETPVKGASPNDQIDAVNIDANGVVYFATTYAGIFAFPTTKGVVNTAAVYAVSNQGAKVMATDGKGNFYVDNNLPSGDVIDLVAVGNITAPATNAGSSSAVTGVSTLLSDGSCTSTGVTFSSTTTEFSANTTGSTCVSLLGTFGSFATNVTFTPAAGGTRTATLTATDSLAASGTATITGMGVSQTAATPTFSPAAGTYTSAQTVAISDATPSASIYYTTNGTMPSTSSTLYTAPITVSSSETIEAIATGSGLTNSAVASAAYTINIPAATPTFSPAGGTYTGAQTVTISDASAGVKIYYTIDGTTPTTSSTVYTVPVAVAATGTLKAIAAGGAFASSAVGSAAYIINTLPYPAIVLSQVTQAAAYPSAGGLSGGNPAGSTMGVNQQGMVIFGNSYGNDVLELNPATGVVTTLGAPGNVGAVAVDGKNNYYFSNLYQTAIVKIPYVNGAYAAFNASPSAGCTGSDTAACNVQGLTNGANGYYFGVLSMTFDAAGDLFFGLTNGNTAPNAIFECTAACQTGSGTAALIYQEPTNSAAQLTIGGMIADAYGDLFFTDSAETSSQVSTVSNVNELVYTAGTGFAAKPVVLYTETPVKGATPNDQIDAVNIDANGVVYFASTFGGIFAFPTTKGVVNTAAVYAVSTQGAKVMATDGKGNFYVDNNLPAGDVVDQVAVGNIVTPTASLTKSSTATNVTTIVNDSSCTSSPTVSFAATEGGSATTEFAAATTGACTAATLGSSGSFATTVTFTPTATGTRTAVLTATDNSKNAATANVTGVGSNQPAAATPSFSVAGGTYTSIQTVTLSDTTSGASIYYTTNGTTPTTSSTLYTGPITVSTSQTIEAIATATGDLNSSVATAVYVINLPPAATPTFSPAAGTYTSAQKVTLADTTAGAAIYYTTDGSTPTSGSTLYSGAITVSATETINAIAVATGYTNSAVGSAIFTINLPAATPTFSVAAGTYTSVQSVAITDTTSGAQIYYTTNGTTPTTSSTLYSGPISVGTTETIEAVAIASGYSISPTASALFTITLPAATPTFTPGAGTYTSIQNVAIASATAGATIYYTINGTAPTTSSTVYTGPVSVGVSETLEAIATASGSTTSAVGMAAYVINLPTATPTFTPNAGTYTSVQTITIADATPGAKVYFTVNGSAPTTSSNLYTGPFQVGATQTVEAIAVAPGYTTSGTASALYTINLPAPTLALSVSPSTLTMPAGQSGTVTVTLTPQGSFAGSVTFSCMGLPADAGCTFSPAIQTVSGTAAVTNTLTVSTTSSSVASQYRVGPFVPAGAVAAACCLFFFRRRRRLQVLFLLTFGLIGLGLLSGCGTTSAAAIAHVPTTSVVTVVATGGSVQSSTTFTLNVQ